VTDEPPPRSGWAPDCEKSRRLAECQTWERDKNPNRSRGKKGETVHDTITVQLVGGGARRTIDSNLYPLDALIRGTRKGDAH